MRKQRRRKRKKNGVFGNLQSEYGKRSTKRMNARRRRRRTTNNEMTDT